HNKTILITNSFRQKGAINQPWAFSFKIMALFVDALYFCKINIFNNYLVLRKNFILTNKLKFFYFSTGFFHYFPNSSLPGCLTKFHFSSWKLQTSLPMFRQ